MPAVQVFTLRNDLSEIARLSDGVERFVMEHGLPSAVLFDLNLVFDELLSNTINYGYPQGGTGSIQVTVSLADDGLALELIDDAVAYNPLDTPEPDLDLDLDDRPIGGLGVFLVKELMDEVAYRHQDGCNVLVLRKRLPPADSSVEPVA